MLFCLLFLTLFDISTSKNIHSTSWMNDSILNKIILMQYSDLNIYPDSGVFLDATKI